MKIYSSIFIILLVGCASFNPYTPLYERYLNYKATLNVHNKGINYSNYFSPKIMKNVDLKDPSVKSQLHFLNYMHNEINHFEKQQSETGCLTLIGYGDNNSPIAFYLEYKKVDNIWKISDIDISFVKTLQELPKEALCPNQARVK